MSDLSVHVTGSTGTITLDRPDRRNALTRGLLAELRQALRDLHQERRVRTVVLTGTGTAFCAGMDLAEMQATAAADNAQVLFGRDAGEYRHLLTEMLRFPKPIVARVNGPAVAGGAGLVLACDLVVAAETARFGLPEPRRGIVAGIVAPLLVYRIGAGQAARLLLTSRLIAAAEAHRLGLYHEQVETFDLDTRVDELATEIARGAPESLQLTKRLLNETIGEQLETHLAAGAAASATARTTDAATEGLAAFLEKREPEWGR